jgi:hypothetical protein
MSYGLVTLTDFLPALVPRLPGCERVLILQVIKDTVRSFCLDTESLTETLPELNVVKDQKEYALDSTLAAEIHRVLEVRLNTTEGVTSGAAGAPLWMARYDYHPATGVLKLNFKPESTVALGLEVDVVLVTRSGTDEVPAWWLNRNEDAIKAGTLYELQRMGRKPWSDPDQAVFNQRIYDAMVGRAKNDVMSGYKTLAPRINLNACVDKVNGEMWGHW